MMTMIMANALMAMNIVEDASLVGGVSTMGVGEVVSREFVGVVVD